MCFFILCLTVCLSVTFGCYPSVRHDQQRFCESRYVFVGVPRRTIDQGNDRAFLVTVLSNLRGAINYPGSSVYIYGFWRSNSCGPTVLQHGRQYIFYGKIRMLIYCLVNVDSLNSRRLTFANYEVRTREALNKLQYYDCSCTIIIGNNRLSDLSPVNIEARPSWGSPRDQCFVTYDSWSCAFRFGYCARRRSPYGSVCRYQVPATGCVDRNPF